LAAVNAGFPARRKGREIKPSIESGPDLGRGDPPGKRNELRGVGEHDSGLLGELAGRGRPQRVLFSPLSVLDGTAREDPRTAHEPRGRISLDEQDLPAAPA